jgi:hypothetical protein
MLKNIRDFISDKNAQIESPQTFVFDPMEVVAIEAADIGRDRYWLKLTLRSGAISTIIFQENYGGGSPNLWPVVKAIENYIKEQYENRPHQ